MKTKFDSLYPLILFILSFAVYGNTFFHGYNLDDEYVTNNHPKTSKGINAIPEIWSSKYVNTEESNEREGYEYRPVVLTTFALESEFFIENPTVSHVFNVFFYSLVCVLLFFALRQVFWRMPVWFAFGSALVFLVHPIHTEVVNSLKNRDEILALLFGLLALLSALRFVKRENWLFLLLALMLFLLSLLSKRSTFPLAVLIPLTLTFALPVRSEKLISLSMGLSVVAGAFLPLSLVWHKALTVVGMVTLPVLVAWPHVLTQAVRGLLKGLTHRIYLQLQQVRRWKWTRLSSPTFLVIVSLIALVVQFEMIATGQRLVAGLLAIVPLLGVVLLQGNGRLISIVLLSTMVSFYSWGFSMFETEQLFICAACFGIAFSEKKVRIVWLMIVVLLVLLQLIFSDLTRNLQMAVPCLALFLITMKFRKGYLVLYLVCVIALVVGFVVLKRPLSDYIFATPAVILGVQVMRQMKVRPHFTLGAVLSITFVGIIFPYHQSGSGIDPNPIGISKYSLQHAKSALDQSVTNIRNEGRRVGYELSSATAPNIVPSAGRSLTFIETPLLFEASISEKLGTSTYVTGKYIQKLFVPWPLGYYYGYNQIPIVRLSHWFSLISLFVVLALVVCAIWLWRASHPVALGIVWMLFCIFPFSNVLVSMAGLFAERLMFTASIGSSVLTACLLFGIFRSRDWNHESKPRTASILVGCGLLLLFGAMTFSRNSCWKDQQTLMECDIEYLSKSVKANHLYATHLVQQSLGVEGIDGSTGKKKLSMKAKKLLQKANVYLKRSVEIYPGFFPGWYDMARLQLMLDERRKALYSFERAIEIDSSFVDANLQAAVLLHEQGNLLKSIRLYERTVRLDAKAGLAYNNLAAIYEDLGRNKEAIEVNRVFANTNPGKYNPLRNLGLLYYRQGDLLNSIRYLKEALDISSFDPQIKQLYIQLLLETGQVEKAERARSRYMIKALGTEF